MVAFEVKSIVLFLLKRNTPIFYSTVRSTLFNVKVNSDKIDWSGWLIQRDEKYDIFVQLDALVVH